MSIKVAINGFGRIGMISAKIISQREDMELVAVNATGEADMIEYLMKYDSVHGNFPECAILENGKKIRVGKDEAVLSSTRDPKEIDYNGADVLLECTGVFLETKKCEPLLEKVKKVVMSAPPKDDTPMYVMGVNHSEYKGEAIISNASCTTNCLAPIAKVLNDNFGLESGLMTTVHSYTNDQNILDVKHPKDRRRARAAALNMIPTTTGAAKAVGKVIPELKGKLNGFAIRVPTPNVSVVDLTATLSKSVTVEEINEQFTKASQNEFEGLILVDEDKRVSSDFISCPYSSIYVPDTTQVVDGKLVKILAWYDNEWGYSSRLVDMAKFVSEQ